MTERNIDSSDARVTASAPAPVSDALEMLTEIRPLIDGLRGRVSRIIASTIGTELKVSVLLVCLWCGLSEASVLGKCEI